MAEECGAADRGPEAAEATQGKKRPRTVHIDDSQHQLLLILYSNIGYLT